MRGWIGAVASFRLHKKGALLRGAFFASFSLHISALVDFGLGLWGSFAVDGSDLFSDGLGGVLVSEVFVSLG